MTAPSTRRHFLTRSVAAVTAAASVHRSLTAQGDEPQGAETRGAEDDASLQIGRRIWKSLKWNMIRTDGSTLEKFQMLKEIGYDGVEIDSPGGVDKEEAIAASRQTGLPIEGIVNSTHWNVRHSDPDPEVRAEALQNMRTAMQDAKRVGADSVLLVPGKVTDAEQENHDQVWERSIAEIHKLSPLAESLQVHILIENVGNGFCESADQFARYIDEIDSPWVAVHFDIGNHIWAGPPADWIRVLGPRIKKLDAKDRTRDRERRKIGEGDAGWADVRAALDEIGYQGWLAAEVTGGDRERLADVLERMNRVVGRSDGNPPKRSIG